VELQSQHTISSLSEATGVSVASIKYYLREELLPPADLTGKHRAFYNESHLERLRLIRALRDIGKLSIPAIRSICQALDQGGAQTLELVSPVIDALGGLKPYGTSTAFTSKKEITKARHDVTEYVKNKGLQVRPEAAALEDLALALLTLRAVIGEDVEVTKFEPYLDAMWKLASQEFQANRHLMTNPVTALPAAVIGTSLWEPVLLTLRRLVHEHFATELLNSPQQPTKPTPQRKPRTKGK
jgi:DNA-binding transcriptional MerR regulator